ncbi:hypothetical protein Dsin_026717 [Dipteronia sinensis]|uniref:RNase H type-1 domain-containing protein n=1 Tax=Dipteronia sinensis TaxID=43782 RepID=A0AAE0DY51_9ROSI|nr:hypothetical protein Dsin_026717 [Dipteronia sinensis]
MSLGGNSFGESKYQIRMSLEVLCLVIWRIWFRRNGRIHHSAEIIDKDIVPWAVSFLDDFRRLNSDTGMAPDRPRSLNSRVVLAAVTPDVAEALDVLRGLEFARDSGLLPCFVESDAQVVVRLINTGIAPLSEVGMIIKDIIFFLECHPNCSISFVPGLANMVAHSLAKFGLSSGINSFWMEEVPPSISPFVLDDCPPAG